MPATVPTTRVRSRKSLPCSQLVSAISTHPWCAERCSIRPSKTFAGLCCALTDRLNKGLPMRARYPQSEKSAAPPGPVSERAFGGRACRIKDAKSDLRDRIHPLPGRARIPKPQRQSADEKKNVEAAAQGLAISGRCDDVPSSDAFAWDAAAPWVEAQGHVGGVITLAHDFGDSR
jgi:hypothetical protein